MLPHLTKYILSDILPQASSTLSYTFPNHQKKFLPNILHTSKQLSLASKEENLAIILDHHFIIKITQIETFKIQLI